MYFYTQSCRCFVRSCALLAVLPGATTFANTIHVPGDYDTIQAAIDAASDSDVVEIASGTYYPSATINTLGKAITLHGAVDGQGDPTTIIDGQGSIRVLECRNSEGDDTIFENLVITGGSFEYGGGMYNRNSSPTLTNCKFTNNTAEGSGGGMYNYYDSNPTLSNCTFTNNTAKDSGGGMYNWFHSRPTLNNCAFTLNSATGDFGYGGGMYNRTCSPTLNDCTFTENSASADGGGMYNYSSSSPTLTNCTFQNNSATGEYGVGGGIYHDGSTLTLINCTLQNNSASNAGGGMWTDSISRLTDTAICGNAPDQVFGTWTDNGGNTVSDVCISDCLGDFNGDGIVDGADLTFLFGFWETNNPVADLNNDGIVDGADLTVVLDAWGACP